MPGVELSPARLRALLEGSSAEAGGGGELASASAAACGADARYVFDWWVRPRANARLLAYHSACPERLSPSGAALAHSDASSGSSGTAAPASALTQFELPTYFSTLFHRLIPVCSDDTVHYH